MQYFVLALITGQIQIHQRGEGITLHAPSHGLQEVYYDMNTWKVMKKIMTSCESDLVLTLGLSPDYNSGLFDPTFVTCM